MKQTSVKSVQLTTAPKKILVVPLRYIGDTVLSVPLIRNLRHCFPESEIDVLVSNTARLILEVCPYVNQCLLEPKGATKTIRFLKDQQYDLVVLLRKSVTMALYCKMAGVPAVIGYDKQRYPWGFKRWAVALDGACEYPHRDTETAQALHHLKMLVVIGQMPKDIHLELWANPDDEIAIDNLFAEHRIDPEKPIAIIHAVSASYGKSVDIERFVPVVRYLLKNHYQILFTGIEVDAEIYTQLLNKYDGFNGKAFNLAGKTSLLETIALLKRTQLLVTVDSSPVHMGLAVGVPKILVIYGPTNYRQWGAYEGIQPAGKQPPIFIPVTEADDDAIATEYMPGKSHIDIAPERILEKLKTLLEAKS